MVSITDISEVTGISDITDITDISDTTIFSPDLSNNNIYIDFHEPIFPANDISEQDLEINAKMQPLHNSILGTRSRAPSPGSRPPSPFSHEQRQRVHNNLINRQYTAKMQDRNESILGSAIRTITSADDNFSKHILGHEHYSNNFLSDTELKNSKIGRASCRERVFATV
jgi:hypothetical protein